MAVIMYIAKHMGLVDGGIEMTNRVFYIYINYIWPRGLGFFSTKPTVYYNVLYKEWTIQ